MCLLFAWIAFRNAMRIWKDSSRFLDIPWVKRECLRVTDLPRAAQIEARFGFGVAFIFLALSLAIAWLLLIENADPRAIKHYVPYVFVPFTLAAFAVRTYVSWFIKRRCA